MPAPGRTGTWGAYANGNTIGASGICHEGGQLVAASSLGTF
jgi:hypothetical protein